MKYYYCDEFSHDGECYTIKELREMMENNEIIEELIEMKRDYGGPMYCEAGEYFPEKGDCGKSCINYKPCNGKSGRCKYLKNGLKQTGNIFVLEKKGKPQEIIRGKKWIWLI